MISCNSHSNSQVRGEYLRFLRLHKVEMLKMKSANLGFQLHGLNIAMIPQGWAFEGFRSPFLLLSSAARDLPGPGGPLFMPPEPMWLVKLGHKGNQMAGGRPELEHFHA